ncbi:MAG: hypothetical protein JOZ77_12360 [Candidatus Eremiobacteraeota bacterium]|nr:hypothetical protein [Candidatus Eremiobacteraeota bacterium]
MGLLSVALLGAAPRSLRDPYLSLLVGTWSVDGRVAGARTHQIAVGRWVLDHNFLLLHFAGSYEADVYIGYDVERHRYVEHWLDIFGGSGATAVGFGTKRDDSLTIRFDYADGPFRNTMRYDALHRGWEIHYASLRGNGEWQSFGDQRLTPANPAR